MVIYIESRKVALAATELETLLWKYVVQKGFEVKLLELGFLIPDDGKIEGYLDEVKIDNIQGKGYPTMADRAVVNREMVSGQFWEFKASSVTAGDFVVLAIYDRSKL